MQNIKFQMKISQTKITLVFFPFILYFIKLWKDWKLFAKLDKDRIQSSLFRV